VRRAFFHFILFYFLVPTIPEGNGGDGDGDDDK